MPVHAVFISLVVWDNIKPGIGILSEVQFCLELCWLPLFVGFIFMPVKECCFIFIVIALDHCQAFIWERIMI